MSAQYRIPLVVSSADAEYDVYTVVRGRVVGLGWRWHFLETMEAPFTYSGYRVLDGLGTCLWGVGRCTSIALKD